MREDFLLEMFYRNNENYRGKVTKYKFLNDDEILFKLKDGTQMIYDFTMNGRRNIIYKNKLNDEQLKKEFRFRLKAMLIHAGITQKDFAEKIGVSEVSIVRYLKGERVPTYILLKRMADVLHCKVDDFYFEPLE